MAASIEELSYELTTGALAEQERALLGLRTRAGTVIATASVAGSFLGSRSIGHALNFFAILALVSFVACLSSALWVLLPHTLVFAYNGASLQGVADDLEDDDVLHAYRTLNVWMQPDLAENRDKIAELSGLFSVSTVFLAVEILLWTISTAG